MTTLELHLPDELAASLARLTIDAESFVLDALRDRLLSIEREQRLVEEYRFAATENQSLVQDFKHVDAENDMLYTSTASM